MTPETQETAPANRRTFLRTVTAAVTIPTAAALVGGALSGTAQAAASPDLPDFAPIPAAATGPALNTQGYFVGRVSGNLYWVTDSFYQAMFLSTREGVVLVDAPPTIGHNLLRAIADVTRVNGWPSKVTHLVYSHSHADHIGAANLFGGDVVRIAHSEARRLLLRDADSNRPIPTVTFDDRFDLRVGGERLALAYHGPNHSPDNIFIHAPDHATLMVVDILYPGWAPFKNLAVSQDIPAWVQAQDIAMGYPWQTLVGGHLGRLGVRADGDVQKQYIADLTASTKAAMSLDPTPYFQKYGPAGNSWAIFKTYLDAVAKQAAAPIVAKYTGVLAAADVFTADNCFAMLESLRIDAGILGPFSIRP
ncbi:glyoxylase-like metal-dependent hydrolase (beta-lactamase superfamily II) [Streptacidiphilus sp. MAP12-16]|uniref:MBL fold metallo-hydrolase n=1 Tax=Streptacidiphilus sp. MAP12-16 TaxID=3156300 RepID=UPI0035186892